MPIELKYYYLVIFFLNLSVGLNKVARRLGIDCAPGKTDCFIKYVRTFLSFIFNIFCFLQAMTGWDYHSGWSHPVYDGFVVCDEHVETLMDAWQVSCLKYVGLILSKIFFI
jgi:hypothetical protein